MYNIYNIYIIYIYIYIYIGLYSRSGRSRILMAFEILEFFDLKMLFTYNRVMELLLDNIC